jgi:hypothetical protein
VPTYGLGAAKRRAAMLELLLEHEELGGGWGAGTKLTLGATARRRWREPLIYSCPPCYGRGAGDQTGESKG